MARKDREFLAIDFEQNRAWRFRPSAGWLARNPCDCPVSIGFILGEHMTHAQLSAFVKQGNAWEVSFAKECQTPRRW
jgi:hypothetical protein